MKPLFRLMLTLALTLLISAALHAQSIDRSIHLDLALDDPLHLMPTDGPEHVALRMTNLDDVNHRVQLTVATENFWGPVDDSPITHTLTLEPNSEQTWTLPISLDRAGLWWFDCQFQVDNGPTRRQRLSLVRMDPTGPTPGRAEGFHFAINTHSTRHDKATQALEVRAAALCGAKVIRHSISWERLQPQPDRWEWEPMDHFLDLLEEQHLELQYLMAFTPRWASTADPNETTYRVWSRVPPEPEAWQTYVKAMAERYGDRVRYWEVWNEPDLGFFQGTVDDYLQMAHVARKHLKPANPDIKIMNGGFSARTDNRAFTEQVIKRGHDLFDIFTWHQHGQVPALRSFLDGWVLPLCQKYAPDTPIWFNEAGLAVPNNSIESQRLQAIAVAKKIITTWSRGAIGYTWYELRSAGKRDNTVENAFGMLMPDFQPKASYATYNALTSVLSGQSMQGQIDWGQDVTAYLLGNDNSQVVLFWAEPAAAGQLLIQTDASAARRVNLMGEREPLDINRQGQLVLDIGSTPAMIELDASQESPTFQGRVFSATPSPIVPGHTAQMRVELRNPTDQPQTFNVQLDLAQPQPQTMSKTVTIAPEQMQPVFFTWETSNSVNVSHSAKAQLSYQSQDSKHQGQLKLKLPYATIVPNATWSPRMKMNQAASVVNLFNDDPHQSHLQWQGQGDLSAIVHFRALPDALRIDLEVQDDVHHPATPDDRGPWTGDSVQLGFGLPGQQTYWELTVAEDSQQDAKPIAWWTVHPDPDAKKESAADIIINRKGSQTRYRMDVPYRELGLTRSRFSEGVKLSVLINDNDGEAREGWIELTPGIGRGKTAEHFQLMLFPETPR